MTGSRISLLSQYQNNLALLQKTNASGFFGCSATRFLNAKSYLFHEIQPDLNESSYIWAFSDHDKEFY